MYMNIAVHHTYTYHIHQYLKQTHILTIILTNIVSLGKHLGKQSSCCARCAGCFSVMALGHNQRRDGWRFKKKHCQNHQFPLNCYGWWFGRFLFLIAPDFVLLGFGFCSIFVATVSFLARIAQLTQHG